MSNCKELCIARRKHQHLQTAGKVHQLRQRDHGILQKESERERAIERERRRGGRDRDREREREREREGEID